MRFKDLLENYRTRRNITATDLAMKVDVSLGYIINVEHGHRPPPKIPLCEKIADALDLSPVEKSLFINAAMEERLDQNEMQWVESKSKSPSGATTSKSENPALPKEISDALSDPVAVHALLLTHKSKKELKDSIDKVIECFAKMDPEKRKAIIALCK